MPTTSRCRSTGWLAAVGCLCAATLSGCGDGLCPSTTFPAEIAVSLPPGALAGRDLLLTVSCPADAPECGFLDGPMTGSATRSVQVTTVLRPPEVLVVLTESGTGDVVQRVRLPVAYEPRGARRTSCGNDDKAMVWVPVAEPAAPT